MSQVLRRNIFTGEWEEESGSSIRAALETVNARSREKVKNLVSGHRPDPYSGGKDFVSKGMSIAPEQATPERIQRENAEAKHHATGAYWTPDGICHLPTRGTRAREMKRLGRMDNDASYGDCAGP